MKNRVIWTGQGNSTGELQKASHQKLKKRRRNFSFKIRSLLASAICLAVFFNPYLQGSDENIPPGSWVYPALRSFELLGAVSLEPDMPYSRAEAEFYLDRILQSVGGGDFDLSPRHRFLLRRMREEFQGNKYRPEQREDRPAYLYRAGRRYMGLDLSAGPVFRKREENEKGELDGIFTPEFLLCTGGKLTYQVAYKLRMEPERGRNSGGATVSDRQRSFRGLTSEFERGYLSFRSGRLRVVAGREYLHWGGRRNESLILSPGAGSLDHLGVYYELGRFEFSTIHSILDPYLERRLAGHRLKVRLPGRIYLGFSETVLYTGRGFDYTYLLPAGSYYANQYNERSDDNILWGIDLKIPVAGQAIIYAELLIDDFQYEGREGAPDKIGFSLGAEKLFVTGGIDLELAVDYTFVDIYTYSHKDSLLTRYVAGSGDTDGSGILGSSLGPDSDRWRFRAAAGVHPRLLVTLDGEYTRRGEGNDFRPWREELDPAPAFPSGSVTEEKRLSISAKYDLERGSYIFAGGGIINTDSGGSTETGRFVQIGFILDI